MRTRHVVTAFLLHPDTRTPRLLLGRRSGRVATYSGRWAAISGALPPHTAPEAQARAELHEELGLTAKRLRFIVEGDPFATSDPSFGIRWVVHPFLFRLRGAGRLRPDWEHTTLQWVPSHAIARRRTVPDLLRGWERVAWSLTTPPALRRVAAAIRADRAHGSAALARRALQALASPRWSVPEVWLGARALAAARPAMATVAVNVALAARAQARGAPGAEAIARADERCTGLARTVAAAVYGTVLTHSYSASVVDGLRVAIERGRVRRVLVTESVPGGEGAEAARGLAGAGAEVSVVADSAAGALVVEADCVLVGADACYGDGSILNKVGTRGLAASAGASAVPVVVALDSTKLRPFPRLWLDVEYRAPRGRGATAGTPAPAPMFDRTEGRLVARILTERGPLQDTVRRALCARHGRALRALGAVAGD